jgi:hypothetical protein
VGEHYHEIASDGPLLTSRHLRDLFYQVRHVQTREGARLEERDLLLGPQAEVALVERRLSLGIVLRACHGLPLI